MGKTPQRFARANPGIAKRKIMSGAAAETCELSNVMAHTMTERREGSKVIAPIRMVGDG
jgi:hypothetical protein